jgi:hypothetical protein
MPRPCQRVRLESGLKPNINSLIERSLIEPGAATGPRAIGWPNKYSGEQIAAATFTADIRGTDEGWLHISSWQQGGFDQRLFLSARPRHFGGLQWFFVCPYTDRRAMVLWNPPGARTFAYRERWGIQRLVKSVVVASEWQEIKIQPALRRDLRSQQQQLTACVRFGESASVQEDQS